MAPTLLLDSFATVAAEPLSRRESMAGEAGTTTLLRAGVVGLLGRASPEERERIGNVLRSLPGSVEGADLEDSLTGGLVPPSGQADHPVPNRRHASVDFVHPAIDSLWHDADEAVFRFRQGDTLGARSSLARALHAVQVGKATPLAAHLLLSYFVQRVLGLAFEAELTRKTLEKAYLPEESS